MRKFGPVAVAMSAMLASTCYAQSPAAMAEATQGLNSDAADQSSEIIVTAQRKSERLQDTPIAVTAVTAETAQQLGLAKAVDIAAITPGANFTVSAGFFSPNIRGLGVAFTAAGLESPVAVYEDGAYLTNSLAANEILDNFDVSSIQVLRGPQGSLYGRNASGGVIIINSADPTFKLEGRVRGEVGNLDHQQLSGMINLPLAQDLALRVTGNYKHNGGYIRNVITGENNGWEKNHNVRAKLRWNPGVANIVLGGEYYNLRNTLTRTSALSRYDDTCLGCLLAPGLIPASVGFYEQIGRSLVPPLRTKYYGTTLKMDFDLDNFTLSSLTTYRNQKSVNNGGDTDGTPLNLFEFVGFKVGGKTFSQDLQVSSDLDGKFDFIFGLNYLRDRRYFRAAFLGAFAGGAMDPNTSPGFLNEGSTDSYAAFLEGYYKVTDELKVTVGGRYTYDERGMHTEAFGFSSDGRTTQRAFTPRFVLSWDNGPTNLYYSFTRGFKAGGFPDGQTGPLVTVRPEKISSHEIGIKQSMLDNRLTLNAAAFYFKNKDQQVQTIRDVTQGAARTSNAGLENYGVEVEMRAVPTEGLNVGITGAWQHPRYKPFEGVIGLVCYNPNVVPTLYSCNPLVDVSVTNLTGTAPPQAPQWSGSFSANYDFVIGSWSASLSGLAQYRSSINYQPGAGGALRHDRDGSLFLANASGYVSPPGENLRIGFYVNNLFDKKYVTRRQTLAPFGTGYNAGLPRTYGLRVEYMF